MIITTPLASFLAFVPAVIVLVLLRANKELSGRPWLFAFVLLNACLFLLDWLPTALGYIGIWSVAVRVEAFLQVHGFWLNAVISLLGWIAFLVFVLRQHPDYQQEQAPQRVFELDVKSGNQTIAVKTGFSWPAFFLGPLWAIYKHMPGIAIALMIGNIIVLFGMDTIFATSFSRYVWTVMPTINIPEWVYDFVASIVLVIGWLFLVGYFGNGWYRASLERKNYQRME